MEGEFRGRFVRGCYFRIIVLGFMEGFGEIGEWAFGEWGRGVWRTAFSDLGESAFSKSSILKKSPPLRLLGLILE